MEFSQTSAKPLGYLRLEIRRLGRRRAQRRACLALMNAGFVLAFMVALLFTLDVTFHLNAVARGKSVVRLHGRNISAVSAVCYSLDSTTRVRNQTRLARRTSAAAGRRSRCSPAI